MARRIIEGTTSEFLARQGLAQSPEIWEDGLRTGGRRGLFEWWYFDATMEDNTTLVVVFFTRSAGHRNSPLSPSVLVTIKRPGCPVRRWVGQFSAEAFSAAEDRCNVRIGDNWVRGDLHTYTLHVEMDEVAVDLELVSKAQPWRPGAGMNFYDEEMETFFAWLAAVPFGEVKGQIRFDGEDHLLQGVGYHDHNWGNTDLHRVLSHWYWGRFHIPPYTGIFVEMTATPAYDRQRIPIVMLARDGRVIFEGGTGHIQVEASDFQPHPGNHRYPTRLEWSAEEGERRVHIALQHPELIKTQFLLETFPAWKRLLARLLGKKPYYFRFCSQITLDIHLPGAQEVVSGSALYEIMYLS